LVFSRVCPETKKIPVLRKSFNADENGKARPTKEKEVWHTDTFGLASTVRDPSFRANLLQRRSRYDE
jgi:hypothetical protein